METVGRIFIGIDLTDDVRHGLAAYLSDLLPELPGQVVAPDNWHLTMRFLGDLDGIRYDRLLHALEESITMRPFMLSFGGLGAFPKPGKASVLWMGVEQGDAELDHLAVEVSEACTAIDVPLEERAFQAHLTLTRIRRPVDVWHLLELEPRPSLRMPVNQVTVFRTDYSEARASYERLESIELP